LFPPDLLDRIAAGEVDGQRPADFGLDGTKRLSEETQSAFSDARARWDAFQRRLHRAPDRATTLTREDWMVPFLELLGFDDLALQRASAEAGGETFFISHRAGDDPAAPPVHIVSCNDDLDRRGPTGRRSPHALVQEYLNRSDAVWGLVTNGRQLRLLRNSTRFARPTYVQFDLEGLIQSNLYGEFVLLYRLLHRSRFPRDAASVAGSWLERYYQQGIDEGGRAREKLREGVEEALKTLGTALLEHPGNEALRQRVAEGTLDAAAYYRQLLRLIYRLLFLLVAEERRLLLPPDSPNPDAFRVYERYYSVSALRERSERYFAGDRHSDLWQGLVATFRLFREDGLARRVGLRALNGELFGPHACPDVENASCANEALLTAVRHLSTFTDDGGGRRRRRAAGVRRRVNYAALDVEELGSVYESLLEYQPQITLAPPGFVLDPEGSERRSTGSYYTPPELVRELIDHALVPVMEEKLRAAKTRDEKEQALLSLRVCDPASGSGHFLLAAARRIGAELARVRTGEEEPSPAARREATRDVIRSCVYAVDKNPLAVDLCKVALWIEANDAGKPLTFLDHHVKCGDSLVGVLDPAVLRDGIPDAAFDRPAGQPKTIGRELKIRNRRERAVHASQRYLPLEDHLDELAAGFEELDRMPDDSPQAVVEKERKFRELTARKDALDDRMACHLWTAPFFLDLASTGDGTPTTATLRRFLQNPGAFDGRVAGIVQKEAGDRRFFHWPLEFPDVFVNGGFDVALSNPPFMGGLKISDGLGDEYRRYLTTVFAPAGGTCDLCAYFYRRAFDLLRPGGHLGMVATNTIGQGDTREGSLAVIVQKGGAINFARRFVKWPGAANVEVNLLAIRRGPWRHECLLDGEPVPAISSRLDHEPEAEPKALLQNRGKAFQGSIVRGIGFVLEPEEAESL
ncbi:MAG TPA: hypothetical protein VNN12_01820, partial [Dehalococcoidia bacterium]|nr:hypothetical protein [Dehalococcoidia bacterium]